MTPDQITGIEVAPASTFSTTQTSAMTSTQKTALAAALSGSASRNAAFIGKYRH
jgi:hypothetical protein